MRTSILFLLLAFFAGVNATHAQDINIAAVPIVVNGMAAHNVYESETIGIANAKSIQFARYQQLVQIATKEQLLGLAEGHTNGVVRLYALQALRERGITIPKSLEQKFKDDVTSVNTLQGCIANQYPISKLASTPLSAKSHYSRQNFIGTSFVN